MAKMLNIYSQEQVSFYFVTCFIDGKKIVEYEIIGDELTRVKEIDVDHRKSIFGMAFLDENTLISAGLDANIISSKIFKDNQGEKQTLVLPGLGVTTIDHLLRRSMNKSANMDHSGIDPPPFEDAYKSDM